MALTECKECQHQISTTATHCPNCGAKVPRFKWWLWIPLAVLAFFVVLGLTTPEYERQASQNRRVCEGLVAPYRKDECRRIYDAAIAIGRAREGQESRFSGGVEAPIDTALVQKAADARATYDAELLKDCKATIAAKLREYKKLMSQREYWSASIAIRRCAQLQDDPTLKALVADAEVKQYVMEIENPATLSDDRNRAVEALIKNYPDIGRKYAELLKQ